MVSGTYMYVDFMRPYRRNPHHHTDSRTMPVWLVRSGLEQSAVCARTQIHGGERKPDALIVLVKPWFNLFRLRDIHARKNTLALSISRYLRLSSGREYTNVCCMEFIATGQPFAIDGTVACGLFGPLPNYTYVGTYYISYRLSSQATQFTFNSQHA